MTSLKDIQEAIRKLGCIELGRLRAWFENHEAARFDEHISRDAESGRLDRFADQAIAEFRKRRF